MNGLLHNYLSIDVEEYFQVAAFRDFIDPRDWPGYESRAASSTRKLLEILAAHDTRATFFMVGWMAERHPQLVREIHSQGHRIGCHSYLHQKIYDLTPDSFRRDTAKAKTLLEDLTGSPVNAYRAPSYSITRRSLWSLPILEELGFTVDSSIFPIYHDNYGIPDSPRFPYRHERLTLNEYPISTALFLGRKIPIGGGGYFRLFPYWFTRSFLKQINERERQPFVFYLHPWEIDPDQPRMEKAGRLSRFRHYNKLDKTLGRLRRLLADFAFQPLPEGAEQSELPSFSLAPPSA